MKTKYNKNFCLKLHLQSPLPCPIELAGRHKKMENLSASPKKGILQFYCKIHRLRKLIIYLSRSRSWLNGEGKNTKVSIWAISYQSEKNLAIFGKANISNYFFRILVSFFYQIYNSKNIHFGWKLISEIPRYIFLSLGYKTFYF